MVIVDERLDAPESVAPGDVLGAGNALEFSLSWILFYIVGIFVVHTILS